MNFVLLLEALRQQHDPIEWRLFDSSKVSLKPVFLPTEKIPTLPLVHATNMTESCESIKLLLEKIQ
jgi:hypothetical protein